MGILHSRNLVFVNGSDDLEKVRDTIKDDPKSGCPSTSVTDKIIADVQQHVKQDRQVTVKEIAETFSISYGSAQEILTENLECRVFAQDGYLGY